MTAWVDSPTHWPDPTPTCYCGNEEFAQESVTMYQYVFIHRRLVVRILAVLLAAIGLVMLATRTGKWMVVHRLAGRIAESDDRTAARLVQELAAFDSTAYPALVHACTSSRSAVALTARREIDKLVADWQQQAFLHPNSFALGPRALPMAEAVDAHAPQMSASGQRWARGVLMGLITLAKQQDLAERLSYLEVCDRALAKLPASDPAPLYESDQQYQLTLAPPRPKPVVSEFVAEPRTIDLSPPLAEPPRTDPAQVVTSPLVLDVPPPVAIDELPASPEEWNPAWSTAQLSEGNPLRVPAHNASTQRQTEEVEDLAGDETEPSDRTWFIKMATGDDAAQESAAKELKRLGYGLVTPLDARMMISASAADRQALVNQVLTSPRLNPNAWLWQLARDPAGEVRAAAISALSTTANRKTIAELLDLVIRDSDPRVAGQAEHLRSKLK